MEELGEGRLREPAEALLSSLISRQVTSLLLGEEDNRKIEMFTHQFQEQCTAGLIWRNSPNFKAKMHQHSEGDTSDWFISSGVLCILTLRKSTK